MVGVGFDRGNRCHESRLTLDRSTPEHAEAVNDFITVPAAIEMDANLNCARRETVHRTFEMLTSINMAFDL